MSLAFLSSASPLILDSYRASPHYSQSTPRLSLDSTYSTYPSVYDRDEPTSPTSPTSNKKPWLSFIRRIRPKRTVVTTSLSADQLPIVHESSTPSSPTPQSEHAPIPTYTPSSYLDPPPPYIPTELPPPCYSTICQNRPWTISRLRSRDGSANREMQRGRRSLEDGRSTRGLGDRITEAWAWHGSSCGGYYTLWPSY